jgi:predicted signal transduction protein with EAL and GGDEF domain
MYQTKKNGGNAYLFFHSELKKELDRKVSLEKAIRKALDRQEFLLHYQPRFNIRSNAIKSAEVLIRWTHSKWGKYYPFGIHSSSGRNGTNHSNWGLGTPDSLFTAKVLGKRRT